MKQIVTNPKIILGILAIVIFLLFLIDLTRPNCNVANTIGREILDVSDIAVRNELNLNLIIAQDGLLQIDNILYMSILNCDALDAINLESQEYVLELDYPAIQIAFDANSKLLYAVGGYKSLIAINNNQVVWENNTQNGQRGRITVYVNEEGNNYANVSSLGVVSVDPQTGYFGEPLPIPRLSPQLYYTRSGYFWRITNSSLEAREITNAETVAWTSNYNRLSECCLDQVWVSEEYIIIRFSSDLWMLSREEGNLLWRYDTSQVVSNFEVVGDEIFVLDINAHLLKLDKLTGNVVGQLEFQTPSSEARDIRVSGETIGSSVIAVNTSYISIFFGDTDTLSVFTRLDQ